MAPANKKQGILGQAKIIKASAGSGKTYRLAYEYVSKVVASPESYRHILAVTFTNKATEEMKQRILAYLGDLARGHNGRGGDPDFLKNLTVDLNMTREQVTENARKAQAKILHDYSHFNISTIDRFFQGVMRAFIRELGADVNFTLEFDTDAIIDLAIDSLMEEMTADEQLRQWILQFSSERIESDKSWDIRATIRQMGEVIKRNDFLSGDRVTIDRQGMTDLLERLSAKEKTINGQMTDVAAQAVAIIGAAGFDYADFKGGARSGVRYFYAVKESGPSAYGNATAKLLGDELEWVAKTSPHKEAIATLVRRLMPLLQQLCGLWEANSRFLATLRIVTADARNIALLSALKEKIDGICRQRGIMLLPQTSMLIGSLIGDNDAPFIYEKTGTRYTDFLIDEFQDTSLKEWNNFLPLLRNAVSQTSGAPLLLVGDVKQSIYRWRGGQWQIMGEMAEREFRAEGSDTLGVNRRSRETIVRFNNALTGSIVQQADTRLNALAADAYDTGLLSPEQTVYLTGMVKRAYADYEQQPKEEDGRGYVTITLHSPDKHDAPPEEKLAHKFIGTIRQLQQRGYRGRDIAILTRTRKEGNRIAAMLLEAKAADTGQTCNFDFITQENLVIGSSDAVRFLASCLNLAFDPENPVELAIYNRFTGNGYGEPLAQDVRQGLKNLLLFSPEEAFDALAVQYGGRFGPGDIAYIQAFHDQLINYMDANPGDLYLFVQWWMEKGCAESAYISGEQDAMTVSTIHKAKGLQYKAVVIPYCEWLNRPHWNERVWVGTDEPDFAALGRIPAGYTKTLAGSYFSQDYYEETVLSAIDSLNTLYVAVTRAEEELHLLVRDDVAADTVGAEIINSFALPDESSVLLGTLHGCLADNGRRYEFGTPHPFEAPAAQSQVLQVATDSYPVTAGKTGLRLRSNFDNSRDDNEGKLSARNYGILLHRLFEGVVTADDIFSALEKMLLDGEIGREERDNLKETLSRRLQNETVARWFAPGQQVNSERNLIVPEEGSTARYRPDRVIVADGGAVVIDYKFGMEQKPEYVRQVKRYLSILRDMGYGKVEGYIWYVLLDEVEKAE